MRTPKEQDLCWCLNIDRRPYMDCQRDYKANQTAELAIEELEYVDEEDCDKYKAPKE